MNDFFREGVRGLFLLALAIGIPLFALSPPEGVHQWLRSFTKRETQDDTAATEDTLDYTAASPLYAAETDELAVPTTNLREVIRFDLSPAWIEQRWPQVVTRLSAGAYYAYRVPLSTGPGPADLMGVLTYYYDVQGRMQSITFQGGTDNYMALTAMLQRYYGFVRRPMNSPLTVVYERPTPGGQEATSRVWIEPSVGVIPMKTRRQYDVTMVVQRPGATAR